MIPAGCGLAIGLLDTKAILRADDAACGLSPVAWRPRPQPAYANKAASPPRRTPQQTSDMPDQPQAG
eukprot:688004-Amphidinium_carterae.1